jgi:hypothetical protein
MNCGVAAFIDWTERPKATPKDPCGRIYVIRFELRPGRENEVSLDPYSPSQVRGEINNPNS